MSPTTGGSVEHTHIYKNTFTNPHNLKCTHSITLLAPGGELSANLSVCHSADMIIQICCCCPGGPWHPFLTYPLILHWNPPPKTETYPTHSKVIHSSLLFPDFTLQAMLRLVLPWWWKTALKFSHPSRSNRELTLVSRTDSSQMFCQWHTWVLLLCFWYLAS